MRKKILIDLTNLSNPTCGFGQIAANYEKNASSFFQDGVEVLFLMPQKGEIKPQPNIVYIKTNKIYKIFKFLLPKVNVWHSTNQQYRYLRLTRSTSQVLTIHDLNFVSEKSSLKVMLKLKKLQYRVNHAAVITAISNYAAEELKKHIDLKGKDIITIYNGVERIDQAESIKPRFVNTDRPFFFTLGQVRKKKNFHVLIDVMKNFPEYDLYISGQDHYEYAKEIRQRILNEKTKNVFLTGTIKNEEKIWLYKNCTAFLFPSTLEGFGLPVIEAMQFGRAVFSSNFTSLPEVCGGNAFIWDNFDPDYMSQMIKEHLKSFYEDEQKIVKMKEYAFSFSYEKHIQQYVAIYKALLKEKKSYQ
jgi:glycosyltransferase involved in cell wall biosynthesis